MPTFSHLRGVLFDIDGTLVDSNDAQTHAWVVALEGEGWWLPFELVRSKIGEGADKLLKDLVNVDAASVLGQTIARHRLEIFKTSYLADLSAFPEVRPLLATMVASGLSLHVASSATSCEIHELLRVAGVSDLFQHVGTKDDPARSKPDPDIVEAALARSGLSADEVVLVGDTPYDIEAAHLAGVSVVAVRSGGHWSDDDLWGAEEIYDDVADILAHWTSSLFSPRATSGAARQSASL